jgi:uncharacterized protein YndB with AHSA1/START domain
MTSTLLVEQRVGAAPAALWPLWTTATGLARWWWPHLPDTTYAVDARPGGPYLIDAPAAGIGVQGEVISLDEPRELVLTWQWLHGGTPGPVDRVRVAFDQRDADTLVRVTHEMAGDQEHDDYRQGWTDVLTRLADLFASAEKGTRG